MKKPIVLYEKPIVYVLPHGKDKRLNPHEITEAYEEMIDVLLLTYKEIINHDPTFGIDARVIIKIEKALEKAGVEL